MKEALSPGHRFDHRWYNPFCKDCRRSKFQRKSRRKKRKDDPEAKPIPKEFGWCCGDHFIERQKRKSDSAAGTDEDNEGVPSEHELGEFPGAKTAVVMIDRGTGMKALFPAATKSFERTRWMRSANGKAPTIR